MLKNRYFSRFYVMRIFALRIFHPSQGTHLISRVLRDSISHFSVGLSQSCFNGIFYVLKFFPTILRSFLIFLSFMHQPLSVCPTFSESTDARDVCLMTLYKSRLAKRLKTSTDTTHIFFVNLSRKPAGTHLTPNVNTHLPHRRNSQGKFVTRLQRELGRTECTRRSPLMSLMFTIIIIIIIFIIIIVIIFIIIIIIIYFIIIV